MTRMWWILAEISFSKWLVRPASSDLKAVLVVYGSQFLRLVSVISCELLLGGGCQYSSPQNRGETTTRLERAAQIEPSQSLFWKCSRFWGSKTDRFPENEFEKTANLDSTTSYRPSVSWPKPFWKRAYLQTISGKTWNNFLFWFRQEVIFLWTFFALESHFEGQCFLKLGNGLSETALMMTV